MLSPQSPVSCRIQNNLCKLLSRPGDESIQVFVLPACNGQWTARLHHLWISTHPQPINPAWLCDCHRHWAPTEKRDSSKWSQKARLLNSETASSLLDLQSREELVFDKALAVNALVNNANVHGAEIKLVADIPEASVAISVRDVTPLEPVRKDERRLQCHVALV